MHWYSSKPAVEQREEGVGEEERAEKEPVATDYRRAKNGELSTMQRNREVRNNTAPQAGQAHSAPQAGQAHLHCGGTP